ncbi:hypothetical protein ACFE04_015626 [Oxalis oulophora]
MWTNVFKIGGLHQLSWFQFLPHESPPLPNDKNCKRMAFLPLGLIPFLDLGIRLKVYTILALRNIIERSLLKLSYMRYGDVFIKSQNEEIFRRGRPTVEFIFSATEEAIFVHAIITSRHVRGISSSDLERVLYNASANRLPVIVSPHGMRGELSGCCPNDMIKQLHFSSGKYMASTGFVGLPPLHGPQWQKSYAEVTIGCPRSGSNKSSNLMRKHYGTESSPALGRADHKGSSDPMSANEKTFVYPAEAVLVPVLQTSFSRSSLKRFWLQNWIGPSFPGSSFFMHCGGNIDCREGCWSEKSGIRREHSYNSSNNSNSSSNNSTLSSCSSDMTASGGDLEADADSLTCKQSSNDQLDNNAPKSGSKRTRPGMVDSNAPPENTYKTDYGSMEINNSGITNDVGSNWDWDDDDRGMGTDIQALLSEFGDFGDFFENDALPFGEPPGTAESQALIFPPPETGDVGSSPGGVMDVSDPMVLPVGFSSFESFNPPSLPTPSDDFQQVSVLTPPTTEFDHLIKAEAIMIFAPEYGAVETPPTEVSSSVFKSPYMPRSFKVDSCNNSTASNYVYGATPPPSPCSDGSDGKSAGKHDAVHSKNCYIHMESGKDIRPTTAKNGNAEGASNQSNLIAGNEDTSHVGLSTKMVPAIAVDCIMFQAFMCRMRHVLLSSSSSSSMPIGLGRSSQLSGGEQSSMTDNNISGRFEVKKKESIPVRIAGGDIDGGMLDGQHGALVGVWRSVGLPKLSKPTSFEHNSFTDETVLTYGQRQPLQQLLDAMVFLVQQATSFVDLTLDAEFGDGPYGWLALQEQWRRTGFPCGPSMVHAGCGGTLASCHSLDIAGVQLIDPLAADIHPSSMISLLQTEMKASLRSAFVMLDGPLTITDWCKGRSQPIDAGMVAEGSSLEGECRDPESIGLSVGDQMSPSQSSSSYLKDGVKMNQEISSSDSDSRLRPTILALPSPAILVGYQDDWLKTSASSLQIWEKAPLEPYALQKPVSYHVVCPDIDPLTSAAVDFFQQLGTVYETCKLGTHSPQSLGNQMEMESGKLSSSGFVLLDCPQSMKIESSTASLVGSISDYFLSLSNGWHLTSYLKSLSKALKSLKIPQHLTTNQKEGTSCPCVVIYVVCPFPEPSAVLQTVIESCVALGSSISSLDKERRSMLHSRIGRTLSCSAAVDESSASNVLALSGFSVPNLVLQFVTVDAIFRVSSPTVSELVMLKETAFTVYNKARRISRGSSNDAVSSSSSSLSNRSLMQMNSMPGMWKDPVTRMTGPSFGREGEIDGSLRPGSWDNHNWQTRSGTMNNCDPNRNGEFMFEEETRYMFEPLFILAEAGLLEQAVAPSGSLGLESIKAVGDDSSSSDSKVDGSQVDDSKSLHCCYGWTEDWRWLVCMWTDARGELLDSQIFSFGGISSRQDTKGLQNLFVQVLQQGCQILEACSSSPRDFVIARIGTFFELEYLEWQKAIYSVGGSEVKKWPLQLRNNGEMGLIQDRALPSSPSPLYSPHSKPSSGFIKGQATSIRKGGHTMVDNSKGLLQWVHSISFVTVSIDHSVNLICQAADLTSGGTNYLEGYTAVKSLGSNSASYLLIPSPSMRFLPSTPLQLPTCLTAESPPLAHLLHSKGSATPLSTAFVVSRAVPSMRKENTTNLKDEWPSVLSVGLIDYYGGEKITRGKQGGGRADAKDLELETHLVLQSLAAELHALSWMTVSPSYLDRRTALPFHCDMVLRLRRLLHFADKQLDKSQP